MRHHNPLIALALVAGLGLIGADAQAQKAKKSPPSGAATATPTDAPAPPQAGPEPGQCVYTQPTLKKCATLDAKGLFEIQTGSIGATYVEFVDGIVSVAAPPESQYGVEWARKRKERVGLNRLYIKAKAGAPDNITMIVVTETLRVTLILRSPNPKVAADSQVEVLDPERDAHLASREQQLTAREQRIAEQEQRLEARAAARAEAQLLEDIAHAGIALRSPGVDTNRNDKQIVLRAKQVARVGSRRFLMFTVENRSDSDFIDVQDVRLWLHEGGTETPLKAVWRLNKKHIATEDGEVLGVISVPLARAPGPKARLRLRVECVEAVPTIELKGIGGL